VEAAGSNPAQSIIKISDSTRIMSLIDRSEMNNLASSGRDFKTIGERTSFKTRIIGNKTGKNSLIQN
jgi:hypothetical protein